MMRRLLPDRLGTACLLLLVPLGWAAVAFAQGPPPSPPPPPGVVTTGGNSGTGPRDTAAVSGVVVDAAGRPLAGVTVTASGRTSGATRFTTSQITTPKGRFVFDELPTSEDCTILVTKAGYLDSGYGRLDPRGPGTPIRLGAGQWVSDLRITMSRPGSITGTVLDERGEPIVGAIVRVLAQVTIAGHNEWLPGMVAPTDDRGAYRIAGLGPGRYVVSLPSVQATLPAGVTIRTPTSGAAASLIDLQNAMAAARAEKLVVDRGAGTTVVVGRYAVPPPPTADGRATAYPITFYPNATTPAEATAIDLALGQERAGIDFSLRPVPTARVSGTVEGPSDAVGNLFVRLVPVGLEEVGQGSEAATTVTLADGRFTFLDVPHGSYVFEARHSRMELTYAPAEEAATTVPAPVAFPASSASASSVRGGPPGIDLVALSDGAEAYWASSRLEVAEDVRNVRIALRRPASLRGRVVIEPGTAPVNAGALAMEPAGGQRSLGMPMWRRDPTKPDPMAIEINGLLGGPYVLHSFGTSARIVSVTWNGEDYLDRAFDMSAGTDVDNVVVTVAASTSAINGSVSAAGGAQTTGAAVIVFPTDVNRWSNYGFNPVRIASARATNDGRFRLEGLPPGDYYAIAVPAAEERAWIDPRYLEARAGRATRLRLDKHDSTLNGIVLTRLP